MSWPLFSLLILSLFFPFSSSSSPSCKQSNPYRTEYDACIDLPVLNASLYWTNYPDLGTTRILFRVIGVTRSNWVSWGLNPTGSGMVGAQVIVAYQTSNGSMHVYTSSIGSNQTRLPETQLSYPVSGLSAKRRKSEVAIYATIQLPQNKSAMVNHVWQVGPVGPHDRPLAHDMQGDSLKAFGTVDFVPVSARPAGGGSSSRQIVKYVHGAMCTLGYGVMMPIGVLMSRYMGVPNSGSTRPLWFEFHSFYDLSACCIGLIGYILGVIVSWSQPGGPHSTIGFLVVMCNNLHYIIGADRFRPNEGHKYWLIWNAGYYILGYGVIGLSWANVFIGLGLLGLDRMWWKKAFIAYLIVFGSVWVLSFPFNWLHNKKRVNAMESMGTLEAGG